VLYSEETTLSGRISQELRGPGRKRKVSGIDAGCGERERKNLFVITTTEGKIQDKVEENKRRGRKQGEVKKSPGERLQGFAVP